MKLPNIDDKDLVILGQIITGLFGIAVGRKQNGN